MISVEMLDGGMPVAGSNPTQVLIDEGTSEFLNWDTGDKVTIMIGNTAHTVEISGITKGEIYEQCISTGLSYLI